MQQKALVAIVRSKRNLRGIKMLYSSGFFRIDSVDKLYNYIIYIYIVDRNIQS